MRALVVTNMYPSAQQPARGSFVRDQVQALQRVPGMELELFAFPSRGPRPYLAAAQELRRRYGRGRFDVVHAHFGLTIWPSLAVPAGAHGATLHGTDLVHPRSRAITLAGVPWLDLVAPVSAALAARVPPRLIRGRLQVLPTGVDLERFRPIDRRRARSALGLDPDGRYLLFPADPQRPEKRFDRARAVAGAVPLLTLGSAPPEQVPLWINAADAVLVPSERESFGLAVLEALACEVPVLATPVGMAPQLLDALPGTLCAEFDPARWRAALARVLAHDDPRVGARTRAERLSADQMATQLVAVWRSLLR